MRTSRSGATPADVPLPTDEPLAAQALALADALDGGPGSDPRREIAVGADGVRALEAAERASAYCLAAAPAENLSVDARR